jgi:acyl-CoA synthetase (AMP-forming)/AMP-acid ligase II
MTQTFGQAEAPMICTFFGPEEHVAALRDAPERLASCGRESLVAHVGIMGDDGHLLGPGEKGEIVVRGALRMSGYYKNPEETAAATKHGWHATGDVGYKDADGYVYIVDRLRDMIITGGFNVFPSQVEQVIWSLPQVRDCAVIGVPDDKWGEAVTAVVELKDGADLECDEVVAACRERLGSVQAPKSVVFRELPRSPVGKVLKRALRDEFWVQQARSV